MSERRQPPEDAYVGCMRADREAGVPSAQRFCVRCGLPVWLSIQAMVDLPRARPICMPCLVWLHIEQDIKWGGIPPNQMAELMHLTGMTEEELLALDVQTEHTIVSLADLLRRLQ